MRKRRVVGWLYGTKCSWKGHTDRHKTRTKRSEQAGLVYVKNINRNIPTTWRWACGDRSHRYPAHTSTLYPVHHPNLNRLYTEGSDRGKRTHTHQVHAVASLTSGPISSPSRDLDVTVYARHKPTELAHSFSFCSWGLFLSLCPFELYFIP